MTEMEWLACSDPVPALESLRGKVSDRKLRLFAVACCRRVWHILTDDRSREAVELAERFADGGVTERVLEAASGAAEEAFEDAITDTDDTPREDNPGVTSSQHAAACSAASYASNTPLREDDVLVVVNATLDSTADPVSLARAQAVLFRDVVGTPHRPVTLAASWFTAASGALARQMYDSRDFSALPILADALQDAGCDNADVLAHCRGDGPHVRGCWVVDLVLGRV